MAKESEKEVKAYTHQLEATQTRSMIVDVEGTEISSGELLVRIANDVSELKKKLVG